MNSETKDNPSSNESKGNNPNGSYKTEILRADMLYANIKQDDKEDNIKKTKQNLKLGSNGVILLANQMCGPVDMIQFHRRRSLDKNQLFNLQIMVKNRERRQTEEKRLSLTESKLMHQNSIKKKQQFQRTNIKRMSKYYCIQQQGPRKSYMPSVEQNQQHFNSSRKQSQEPGNSNNNMSSNNNNQFLGSDQKTNINNSSMKIPSNRNSNHSLIENTEKKEKEEQSSKGKGDNEVLNENFEYMMRRRSCYCKHCGILTLKQTADYQHPLPNQPRSKYIYLQIYFLKKYIPSLIKLIKKNEYLKGKQKFHLRESILQNSGDGQNKLLLSAGKDSAEIKQILSATIKGNKSKRNIRSSRNLNEDSDSMQNSEAITPLDPLEQKQDEIKKQFHVKQFNNIVQLLHDYMKKRFKIKVFNHRQQKPVERGHKSVVSTQIKNSLSLPPNTKLFGFNKIKTMQDKPENSLSTSQPKLQDEKPQEDKFNLQNSVTMAVSSAYNNSIFGKKPSIILEKDEEDMMGESMIQSSLKKLAASNKVNGITNRYDFARPTVKVINSNLDDLSFISDTSSMTSSSESEQESDKKNKRTYQCLEDNQEGREDKFNEDGKFLRKGGKENSILKMFRKSILIHDNQISQILQDSYAKNQEREKSSRKQTMIKQFQQPQNSQEGENLISNFDTNTNNNVQKPKLKKQKTRLYNDNKGKKLTNITPKSGSFLDNNRKSLKMIAPYHHSNTGLKIGQSIAKSQSSANQSVYRQGRTDTDQSHNNEEDSDYTSISGDDLLCDLDEDLDGRIEREGNGKSPKKKINSKFFNGLHKFSVLNEFYIKNKPHNNLQNLCSAGKDSQEVVQSALISTLLGKNNNSSSRQNLFNSVDQKDLQGEQGVSVNYEQDKRGSGPKKIKKLRVKNLAENNNIPKVQFLQKSEDALVGNILKKEREPKPRSILNKKQKYDAYDFNKSFYNSFFYEKSKHNSSVVSNGSQNYLDSYMQFSQPSLITKSSCFNTSTNLNHSKSVQQQQTLQQQQLSMQLPMQKESSMYKNILSKKMQDIDSPHTQNNNSEIIKTEENNSDVREGNIKNTLSKILGRKIGQPNNNNNANNNNSSSISTGNMFQKQQLSQSFVQPSHSNMLSPSNNMLQQSQILQCNTPKYVPNGNLGKKNQSVANIFETQQNKKKETSITLFSPQKPLYQNKTSQFSSPTLQPTQNTEQFIKLPEISNKPRNNIKKSKYKGKNKSFQISKETMNGAQNIYQV